MFETPDDGDPYVDAALHADEFETYWRDEHEAAYRLETCWVMADAAEDGEEVTYDMLAQQSLHNGTFWDARTGAAYVEWLRQAQACRPFGMGGEDQYTGGLEEDLIEDVVFPRWYNAPQEQHTAMCAEFFEIGPEATAQNLVETEPWPMRAADWMVALLDERCVDPADRTCISDEHMINAIIAMDAELYGEDEPRITPTVDISAIDCDLGLADVSVGPVNGGEGMGADIALEDVSRVVPRTWTAYSPPERSTTLAQPSPPTSRFPRT